MNVECLALASPAKIEPEARLLSASEAAAYLGYSSTEVLKVVPVQAIRIAASGIGAGPRYDRRALDRWLDDLSGVPHITVMPEVSEVDPFQEWNRKNGH